MNFRGQRVNNSADLCNDSKYHIFIWPAGKWILSSSSYVLQISLRDELVSWRLESKVCTKETPLERVDFLASWSELSWTGPNQSVLTSNRGNNSL